jgi:hypothetical protein
MHNNKRIAISKNIPENIFSMNIDIIHIFSHVFILKNKNARCFIKNTNDGEVIGK